MKKMKVLLFLLSLALPGVGQQSFKYVIIPTRFSDLGPGFNPYQLSSALQDVLNGNGIPTVFESDQRPADYCDALVAELEKSSSLFTNKLVVRFRDCQNNIIWSREGEGRSKDFTLGYAEALADALDGFTVLPPNNKLVQTVLRYATPGNPVASPAVSRFSRGEHPVAEPTETVASESVVKETVPAEAVETERPAPVRSPVSVPGKIADPATEEMNYQPDNLYFNETYLVDFVDATDQANRLVVINGSKLGYDKLQVIAELEPTDLPGMYTVSWETPEGETLRGIATVSGGKLDIKLRSGDESLEINLLKQ
ncbi:MAG: hypothetical protein AB7D05_03470 [Mangrovibacterium sp.]